MSGSSAASMATSFGVDDDAGMGGLETAPARAGHLQAPAQPEMPAVSEAHHVKPQPRGLRLGTVVLAADLQRGDRHLDLGCAGATGRKIEPLEIELDQPIAVVGSARTAGRPAVLAGGCAAIHP